MNNAAYHLFQGYGIELEYMIVDKDTLQVKPLSDVLLQSELGEIGSDFVNERITWSNELVLHVIELKSTRPESDLSGIEKEFANNISRINTILKRWNAMLLPTAAHPFMDPFTETKLWPHDNNEVYALYNKIFDCSGHGWSNLQSTHLNLPFSGNDEFKKLHAAIRLILPLLPGLCASSPLLNGQLTGMLDTRLKYYKSNQSKIPSITGQVIPEAVFSFEDYTQKIYQPIEKDISVFNVNDILDPVWVNSRGAIARFDRGSIEIRIMDIQECPAADLAIVNVVIRLLKALVDETFCSLTNQMQMNTDTLTLIFDQTIILGNQLRIDNEDYLRVFGQSTSMTIHDLWINLLSSLPETTYHDKKSTEIIYTILQYGSLSERITKAINKDSSRDHIKNIYLTLANCLSENKMFIA